MTEPEPVDPVDIREIDTSDMAEVEKLYGLAASSPPTSGEAPEPPPSVGPDAEAPLFAATGWGSGSEMGSGRYRGRRRTDVAKASFWSAVVAVLVTIGGFIYWVSSLTAPLPGLGLLEPSGRGTENSSTTSASVAGSPTSALSTAPTLTASPTPSPFTSTGTTAPPPVFQPFSLEAELGSPGGGAVIDRNNRASGRKIVRRMGNWGTAEPGTLTIKTGVVPTAGPYALTISYLHTNGEHSRTAIITVNSVALPATTFTVEDGSCCYVLTIPVILQVGVNTIMFSNPTGHAPELDKFLVTRPN